MQAERAARGLGGLRVRRETGGQRRGKDEEGQTGRQRKRNRDALTEAIGFLTARRLLCARAIMPFTSAVIGFGQGFQPVCGAADTLVAP